MRRCSRRFCSACSGSAQPATAHLSGLITGTAAAMLHHGLTLPIEAHPGIHGGWITVIHHYPSDMAQNFWTRDLRLQRQLYRHRDREPCDQAQARGGTGGPGSLAHIKCRPSAHLVWWKRPEALAVAVLVGAIALNIFFA